MSPFVRVATASASFTALGALLLAQGCSAPADATTGERAASSDEALSRCPAGTTADCEYDLGPTGKPILSCICVPIPLTPRALSVAHDDDGGCILMSDGSVQCWAGRKLLTGDGGYKVVPPTYALSTIALPKAATSVSAGSYAYLDVACAVLGDATVWCWGANQLGELGNGTTLPSAGPVQVLTQGPSGLTPLLAKQVTTGNGFSCALTTLGGVSCWGDNYFGTLGSASAAGSSQSDVAVPAGPFPSAVTSVAAGATHACAILVDGSVYCWGDNGGFAGGAYGSSLFNGPSLGVGSTSWSVPTPALVSGLPPATAVAGGFETTCASAAGEMYCWGMIGAASAPASATPVVLGAAPSAFALGEYDACESVGGTPECWGTSPVNGTFATTLTPVFPGSVSATAVAVGAHSACVLTTGAGVICRNSAYASPVTVF